MKSYYLLKDKRGFLIDIERKNIKNYNLRILPDNRIYCSVPLDSSDEEVSKFLKQKENWIYKRNAMQAKLQIIQDNNLVKQGGAVKILGHSYAVNVVVSDKNSVELCDRQIIFHVKNNDCDIEKKYSEFARVEMRKYFQNIVDRFYPIIKKHKKNKPYVNIRKMKQCWGTSNPEKEIITLNEYLYRAHPFCVEYVILHEMTHFLYPHHNKAFYNFMSVHMPDWQERKKKLNAEFSI